MITNLPAFANGLLGYAQGDHGYDFAPARDTGSGLTLHTQEPRIPYGAALPLPLGTPWQIQRLPGGTAGLSEVLTAQAALGTALSGDDLSSLDADPWYRVLRSV